MILSSTSLSLLWQIKYFRQIKKPIQASAAHFSYSTLNIFLKQIRFGAFLPSFVMLNSYCFSVYVSMCVWCVYIDIYQEKYQVRKILYVRM